MLPAILLKDMLGRDGKLWLTTRRLCDSVTSPPVSCSRGGPRKSSPMANQHVFFFNVFSTLPSLPGAPGVCFLRGVRLGAMVTLAARKKDTSMLIKWFIMDRLSDHAGCDRLHLGTSFLGSFGPQWHTESIPPSKSSTVLP